MGKGLLGINTKEMSATARRDWEDRIAGLCLAFESVNDFVPRER